MNTLTEITPAVMPSRVETARWFDVAGAPALTDQAGRLFRPDRLKVWDRLHTGWCAVVYGQLADGTGPASRVFAHGRDADQLPAWVRRHLLVRRPSPDADLLLQQIERYARDYVRRGFDVQAERDDIERQLVALAHAGAAGMGQPGQPRILVRQIDRGPGRKSSLDTQVTGVQDSDEAVALMMMVVEKITGVSADSYMRKVDEFRRVMAPRPQGPYETLRDHAGLGLPCGQCAGPCRIDDEEPLVCGCASTEASMANCAVHGYASNEDRLARWEATQ